MLEFLLLLFCCRSGTLSNALWGRGRLLIPTRALPGIAGRRGDAGPACFPQMLCEHPLGLSPSCLHVCLSFLERLVKVSDKSTCQMLGSRPPHQCWTELPKTQISPGPSLLLKTLPWLLDIPWAKTHTPARACLIRSPPPCPPPTDLCLPLPKLYPMSGPQPSARHTQTSRITPPCLCPRCSLRPDTLPPSTPWSTPTHLSTLTSCLGLPGKHVPRCPATSTAIGLLLCALWASHISPEL